MPISVLCPSCSAPVTAPDSAAGKRAKCPKCQELMLLPDAAADDFEVVDEPAPKKKPRVVEDDEDDERPRKKPSRRVVAAEDDDEEDERPKKKSRRRDDEDDDERPRKKGKASKKAGPPMGLIVGGGLALLLLVAGGLYFGLKGGGSSAATGGGGAAPAAAPKGPNWIPFDAPDGSFSSAFPDGAPNPETLESLARQSGAANANPEELAKGMEIMKSLGLKMEGWSRSHQERKYIVFVMSVPPALAGQMTPDALMKQGQQQGKDNILSQTDFTAGGLQGKQIASHDKAKNKWTFGRIGTAGQGKIVMLMVESGKEIKVDDADALAFLGKFQWKK